MQFPAVDKLVENELKPVVVVYIVTNVVLFAAQPSVFFGRREDRINGNSLIIYGRKMLLYDIFDHIGDQSSEQRGREFETGIRVNLDQIHFEFFVDHVV